jgi:hypothetical protein
MTQHEKHVKPKSRPFEMRMRIRKHVSDVKALLAENRRREIPAVVSGEERRHESIGILPTRLSIARRLKEILRSLTP